MAENYVRNSSPKNYDIYVRYKPVRLIYHEDSHQLRYQDTPSSIARMQRNE